jgi:hypothetical protein
MLMGIRRGVRRGRDVDMVMGNTEGRGIGITRNQGRDTSINTETTLNTNTGKHMDITIIVREIETKTTESTDLETGAVEVHGIDTAPKVIEETCQSPSPKAHHTQIPTS